MSPGKVAAQCCHACLNAVTDASDANMVKEWRRQGETIICLTVKDRDEFTSIVLKAVMAGISVAVVTDAGRTEVKQSGTQTCVAIGPFYSDDQDAVTGGLKLYR